MLTARDRTTIWLYIITFTITAFIAWRNWAYQFLPPLLIGLAIQIGLLIADFIITINRSHND